MKRLFLLSVVALVLLFISTAAVASTHNWYYIDNQGNVHEAQESDMHTLHEWGEEVSGWVLVVSELTEDELRSGVITEQVEKEPNGRKPKALKPEDLFEEEPVHQKKHEKEEKEFKEESQQEGNKEEEDPFDDDSGAELEQEESADETDDFADDEEDPFDDDSGEELEKEEDAAEADDYADDEEAAAAEEDPFDDEFDDELEEELEQATVADPLSPFNYAMFVVNDKLYFFFFKPLAQGWGFILPEIVRVGIQNLFNNVAFPVRFFNNLFQGKVKRSGIELSRFLINTTVGIVGILDPAKRLFDLNPYIEDFGQTLGVWGMGHGFYLTCPLVGPLTLRDGLGRIPDTVLDPLTFIPFIGWVKTINETSLKIGDYEALKEASLDPYVAVRNAYVQHRNALTAE